MTPTCFQCQSRAGVLAVAPRSDARTYRYPGGETHLDYVDVEDVKRICEECWKATRDDENADLALSPFIRSRSTLDLETGEGRN